MQISKHYNDGDDNDLQINLQNQTCTFEEKTKQNEIQRIQTMSLKNNWL